MSARGAARSFGSADALLAVQETIDRLGADGKPQQDRLRLRLVPRRTVRSMVKRGKVYTRRDHDLIAWLERGGTGIMTLRGIRACSSSGRQGWTSKPSRPQPLLWDSSNFGEVRTSVGGVARNIAENLARLEVRHILLTAVGKDALRQACHPLFAEIAVSTAVTCAP